MSWIEKAIKRLKEKEQKEGLTEDEHISLQEYEGRLDSIEWERNYLNGEDE